MKSIGIEGKALNLMINYLENRRQIVVVGGEESDETEVTSGAAQGSILGPFLFLIYIDDLLRLKLNSVGRLYADDAAFLYTATDFKSLYRLMQSDLKTITAFLRTINLTVSIKKTKFMIFRTTNSKAEGVFDKIFFENTFISAVSEFKYLGLLIDANLNWKAHVNYVASKISPFVGVLRRVRTVLEKKVLLNLYYAHIHSRLIYCLPVWSSCSQELKMKLQILQNKAIKFINFKPHLTPTSLLYNCEFLPFLKVCEYESTLFLFKIHTGLVKTDVSLKINRSITNRETRQSGLLRMPFFLMAKSQNSLFYRGLENYNKFLKQHPIIVTQRLSEVKPIMKKFVFLSN